MTSSQPSPMYDRSTALIVVDMQNDFAHPDGSLFVDGADDLVAPINDEIAAARRAGAHIVYTQDWHPPVTPHFQPQGSWPVHCVGGTWGAELVDGLDPSADVILRKGTGGEDGYSAFTIRDPDDGTESSTGLAGLLRDVGVTRLVVVGVATDVCVAATARDGVDCGFDVVLHWYASRPVEREVDHLPNELRTAGIQVHGI
jgi:nicotinamidase/pyrazinamidase